MSKNFYEINHPVLRHKLGYIRDKNTSAPEFRRLVSEASKLIAYEATKDLPLEAIEVETPIEKCISKRVEQRPIIVSIMRAGNAMLDSILDIIPFAAAGHIGIYRDKFIHNTVEYYFKIPENSEGQEVLLCDPLIATGDTLIACLDRLKQYGVGKIKVLSLLVSPIALERVHNFHPDVDIYCIKKEKGITDNGYLVPGVGDAGDRLYNTK